MSPAALDSSPSLETMPPLNVPALLRSYGLHPDKSLGQNFLVEDSWLRKIVNISEISDQLSVLEIGPGLGSLTRYLAEKSDKVIAVELDERLLPPLGSVLSKYQNVEIIQGDILDKDPDHLISAEEYVVVANIPYYITSAIIRHLLEASKRPLRMILTVQSEVAERICAQPNKMSLLALSIQLYGHPEIKCNIPASAFYPLPNVDSATVRVDIYPKPVIADQNINAFFRLAKAGFSQKRKTLRNALAGGMGWSKAKSEYLLETAGINPKRRAETLTLEEWSTIVEQSQNKFSA